MRIERFVADKGSFYVTLRFSKEVRRLGSRQIRTRPYKPKTNGKVEGFIQTLLRECACAIPFASSVARTTNFTRWLNWCNQERTQSALKAQLPASALNHLVRTHG